MCIRVLLFAGKTDILMKVRCNESIDEKGFSVIGDGPDFYLWQREVTYSPEDKRVVLLTNLENHMTDAELYEQMKNVREKHV